MMQGSSVSIKNLEYSAMPRDTHGKRYCNVFDIGFFLIYLHGHSRFSNTHNYLPYDNNDPAPTRGFNYQEQ